ncbi:hypothetical protein SETIT_7G003600v2 [Setaria italica]|uniref:Disease resistance protein At4g27190-like leucine-rich repeats domain-containing protein n=1 Tax=Setaria italica TaxID=4555 RepID=K3YCA9_SETIT|nr:uncharacterized protein LOC101764937 [Setaria italica]RCV32447.1 hypothetical protein SETIT_7G003600v2 [Setaria italica]
MRSEVIEADTIDAAAEQILNELSKDTTRRSSRSRENVIYFDGWDGLGASAVLRTVAQRLAASASDEQPAPDGVQFHHIIHIDCSKWESRRAVQRAIAEQLKLPARVMEMLDRQDEEDDFHGLAEGSRAEIPQVVTEIYEFIQNHRFVAIFLNGSCEEVDLTEFGLPLYGYTSNKMLWTFRGRFRLNPRMEIDRAVKSTGVTDVFFTASRHEQDPQVHWSYLVHQEAADLIARKITDTAGGIMYSPAQVEDCFLYMLKLCVMTGGHHSIDYDLTTHGCNYWICDGIIQQGDDGDDGAWRAADDLQQEMRLDVECYHQYLSPHIMLRRAETMPYWTSPSYGFLLSPANGDIFQQLNKPIDVLKLSHCSFSFSSPPFLCCHNLRFLWLEHCQDQAIGTDGAADKEQVIQRCFQRLWVLDVRYTRCDWILSARTLDFMDQLKELNVMGAQGWDMGQLQGRLPNIRKLRVTKSTVGCSNCSENNLIFLGMNKMELLEFSGNRTTMPGVANIPEMSTSNNCLETVIIIDGCVGIQKFSFRGCAKLKHILLSGLFEDLRILDLSGTAIKTLDLNAMIVRNLDELLLDGCEKLCAILWPPEDRRKSHLQKLHIDTTQSAAASLLAPGRDEKSMEGRNTTTRVRRRSSASLSVAHGGQLPSGFYWCIWVRDARLLRSLVPLKSYFDTRDVHMEISSPAVALGSASKEAVDSRSSMKQGKDNSTYTDVVDSFKDRMLLQASQGDGDAPTLTGICPCPDMPSLAASNCYMHMQDRGQPRSTESLQEGEETSTITMPDLICRRALILHVHDSLSITSIPGHAPAMSSKWYRLDWCRVERCPKLGCVFTTPQLEGSGDEPIFYYLKTFWASQLPKARYIWNWSRTLAFDIGRRSFEDLKILHLDLCPRIIHVLPLAMPMVEHSLRNLVTLEIVWCGNLEVVFPLYTDAGGSHQHQEQSIITVELRNLERIHLHELPKLQGICGRWMISAPMLETVKIRGCWSLKRLPAVSSGGSKKVECDCEKEWWEKLEWDMGANHHPSLYKPIHSRYYKKTMLRGSVLT